MHASRVRLPTYAIIAAFETIAFPARQQRRRAHDLATLGVLMKLLQAFSTWLTLLTAAAPANGCFCKRAKLQFSRENWRRLGCTWCVTARREFSIFIEKRSPLSGDAFLLVVLAKRIDLATGWKRQVGSAFARFHSRRLGNCSCVSYFSFWTESYHVDYTLLHRASKSWFLRNFRIFKVFEIFRNFRIFLKNF